VSIAAYDRNSPPATLDHANFGHPCADLMVSDPTARTGFSRTITIQPSVKLPAGTIFRDDELPPPSRFLEACTVEMVHAYTEPVATTLFAPDHATLVSSGGEDVLLDESIWHSELFFSDWFRNDRTTRWQWRIRHGWTPVARVLVPVNHCYHRFEQQYFHWFMDSLPRVWMLKQGSPYDSPAKWLVGPLQHEFQRVSLSLFDIRPEDCLWIGPETVEFSSTVVPAFRFQEPLKTRPSFANGLHHRGWSPAYFQDLCDRVYSRFNIGTEPPDQLVYVGRRNAEHRNMVNRDAVESVLDEFGFAAVYPGELSFEDQVRTFARARVIVGPHGAGMTNMLWARPGAKVLEFMPHSLDDPGYRFAAQLRGHDYGCLMARCFDHPDGAAFADIEVNIDVLRRALREIV
jgi:hypothetical protein